MSTSMISRDVDTFVSLGQAMSLASVEGALDPENSRDLTAALVAGILTGGMELDTYARVHEALARLLEQAFEGPARPLPASRAGRSNGAAAAEPLDVYLEVVGEAWERVGWEENCERLKAFARAAFDLDRARFGGEAWFRAPLRADIDTLLRAARAAGLLVVSIEGAPAGKLSEGSLREADVSQGRFRVVLGWGERRAALDLQ